MQRTDNRFFLILLAAVSVSLLLVLQPYFGAILWAVIAALLFAPINERLVRLLGGRRNIAATLTLLIIVFLVVVPALLLGMVMLREILAIYDTVKAGTFDLTQVVTQAQRALPHWMMDLLNRLGWSDFVAIRDQLTGGVAAAAQAIALKAVDFSQSAFGFVVALGVTLYLSFFLLRDGQRMASRVEQAIPLSPALCRALFAKIAAVMRATIKGSFVVAIAQGTIGGVVFAALGISAALLWGIAMGFFSLLPAIGSGLIWVPVAIYLFATGAIWKGAILVFCGLFVIGLVDNLLRPVLVGRETQLPDYVVFVSTLGGLSLFGFNGIVVGPVIAALFIAVWDIFAERQQGKAAG
jgi:predicted PurR-regulated permease PerM